MLNSSETVPNQKAVSSAVPIDLADICIGYSDSARSCISKNGPSHHYPRNRWPAMAQDDGYTSYALKLIEGDLVEPNAKISVTESGIDALMASYLLSIYASAGPNALTPSITNRVKDILPNLSRLTNSREEPWKPGTRMLGVREEDLEKPEFVLMAYRPTKDFCEAFLVGLWGRFLSVLPPSEENQAATLEALRATLSKQVPLFWPVDLTSPPPDMVLVGDIVAVYPIADTRWRPVIVCRDDDQNSAEKPTSSVVVNPSLLAGLEDSGKSEWLNGLISALVQTERKIGIEDSLWRWTYRGPRLFRNRPYEGSCGLTEVEIAEVVDKWYHSTKFYYFP